MAQNQETYYTCDKCKKKLEGWRHAINIMTSISEGSLWSRLHVKILLRSGFHNDSKEESADLCRECTVTLLKDALQRVLAGERATSGTEDSKELGWES